MKTGVEFFSQHKESTPEAATSERKNNGSALGVDLASERLMSRE
jgi:hypothetical protein